MNTVYSRLRADEIEISFMSIIKQCVKHIRFIIVVALVAAILLPTLKYALDYKDYQNSISEINTYELEEIEELLTDREKNALEEYEVLRAKLLSLEEYKSGSSLMTMNSNSVYSTKLQFWVDSENKDEARIANVYINFIENGGLAKAIEVKDKSMKAEFVQELIWNQSEEEIESDGVIELMIVSDTEEGCNELVSMTETILGEYCTNMQLDVGTHTISCVQKLTDYGYVEKVYGLQKQHYETYTWICNLIENAEQGFTETQRAIALANEVEDEDNEATSEPTVRVLFVMLGFLIGVVIAIIVIAVREILNGMIHSDLEMNKRFEYRHLETIFYNPNTLINRMFYKKRIQNVQLENTVAKIISRLKDVDAEGIAVLGRYNAQAQVYVTKTIDLLIGKGIKVEVFEDIVNNVEEYEKLKNYKYAIYISEIENEKVSTLYSEKSICSDIGLDVIGYIAICE